MSSNSSVRTRKFNRMADERQALIRSLAKSLIISGHIETTRPRAKVVISYTEKLITRAQKGTVHSLRQIASELGGDRSTITMLTSARHSKRGGNIKITSLSRRAGDDTPMARLELVSFRDDSKPISSKEENPSSKEKAKKPVATKSSRIGAAK